MGHRKPINDLAQEAIGLPSFGIGYAYRYGS
jgi:hypothetical protein